MVPHVGDRCVINILIIEVAVYVVECEVEKLSSVRLYIGTLADIHVQFKASHMKSFVYNYTEVFPTFEQIAITC